MFESAMFCRRERKSLKKLKKLLKQEPPLGSVYPYFFTKSCSNRMCKGCFYHGKSDIGVPRKDCRLLDRAIKLKLITPSQIVSTYRVVEELIKLSISNIIEM